MSSSAFTPTQIEVTNNVPVNVPVVTAWEYFIPSFTGLGSATFSQNNGYWRRSGDSIEIEVATVVNNVGSGSNPVAITLPNSLSIDWSKLGEISGSGNAYSIVGVGNFNPSAYNTFAVTARQDVGIVFAKNGGGNLLGSELTPSTTQFSFNFKIPVSQWSGSGTTTLATRAVEEYAWNSDTSNASNTSAFGYGPDGVNFLSTTPATAAISKRVRFQTPIQPTDSIIFEVNTNGLWRQLSAEAATTAGQQIYTYITHYNNAYGAGRILQVNSTDVDVSFAKYASTGTTYDAASGGLWGSIAAGTAKWRLRKVSSGAQVGYPVSARNIVGDTSGSVVPTGMLGERITWATAPVTQTLTTTEVDWTNATINLTAGVWNIFCNISMVYNCGSTASSIGNSQFKLTDSSNNVVQNCWKQISCSQANVSVTTSVSASCVVSISSNTTYKIRVLRYDAIGTGSGSVYNTPSASSEFYAVRIA